MKYTYEIIEGLTQCVNGCSKNCPYRGRKTCKEELMLDALKWIELKLDINSKDLESFS